MYFDSVSALLQMDGHGSYVWSAYGITALTLIALLVAPLQRKKRQLRELRAHYRREQA
ncbi:heme exporter protein CcmD [Litorivivens sp.]|uniref:heme exporter protein CcmD n=1 Tax=Litorivivens sp. TaxID=2020868 RepID=UPI0035613FD5